MWAKYGPRVGPAEGGGTREWVVQRQPDVVRGGTIHMSGPVPAGRLRRFAGGKGHEPMEAPFDAALRPGMLVELQWKKDRWAGRFNWWFALVHKVVGPDTVELCFPQYGRNEGSLTHISKIHRTEMTPMHGGVAGGIRRASLAQVRQWWAVLLTNERDMHDDDDERAAMARWDHSYPLTPERRREVHRLGIYTILRSPRRSPPTPMQSSIQRLRRRFREFCPAEQPRLSLELAGVDAAEAAHEAAALLAAPWGGEDGPAPSTWRGSEVGGCRCTK